MFYNDFLGSQLIKQQQKQNFKSFKRLERLSMYHITTCHSEIEG